MAAKKTNATNSSSAEARSALAAGHKARDVETRKKIVTLASTVAKQALGGTDPLVRIPTRSRGNTVWNRKRGILEMGDATSDRPPEATLEVIDTGPGIDPRRHESIFRPYLTDNDIKRANEIAAYPWFAGHKGWQKEIRDLLSNGFKMEVESLITKDISYVTETYVPERLKAKDWLD